MRPAPMLSNVYGPVSSMGGRLHLAVLPLPHHSCRLLLWWCSEGPQSRHPLRVRCMQHGGVKAFFHHTDAPGGASEIQAGADGSTGSGLQGSMHGSGFDSIDSPGNQCIHHGSALAWNVRGRGKPCRHGMSAQGAGGGETYRKFPHHLWWRSAKRASCDALRRYQHVLTGMRSAEDTNNIKRFVAVPIDAASSFAWHYRGRDRKLATPIKTLAHGAELGHSRGAPIS